ncbi:PadR family transcriptional regulator [Streptomyces phaeochromogenes]|uniref:Helix-turn-helix transcriptional regulator n=1 Tax=Streptomyces liliifuscus TaxID=2797636 RepID=A0A7T7L1V5_9ACTN|nr:MULTISPECIES: PadR family transcriptional regulator [Streptomyces]MCX5598584.1 PadR family transcriptional regulator [Streptomyces phaeochromogenes]QQM44816.1 helix-turn-helix transcriptional regulator [Streptomyces liliifuscus]WSJ03867.1 PadR family transcriptional regulator [Streptomyces phaeochromogenes]WSS97773.1 PadR family transcriptional regulator [Streptomyces phaeochromogenes]WSW13186.1 PadR family transcriptional regulator [Streptomyces phaeochromogenes]
MRSHGEEYGPGFGPGEGRGRGRGGPGHPGRGGFEGRRSAFGPFGPGFGGPGFGPGPWGGRGGRGGPRGRARRGDVRASILALLKDRPMHGYEMIQEIAERSGGAWKPSPGSVYPTLQLLEDEGLISSATEGGKKLFSLTDAGRTAADEGPEAPWEDAGRGVDWEALSDIRQAGFGLMEAFGQVWKTGSKEQREKALTVINDARKKLYLILADED